MLWNFPPVFLLVLAEFGDFTFLIYFGLTSACRHKYFSLICHLWESAFHIGIYKRQVLFLLFIFNSVDNKLSRQQKIHKINFYIVYNSNFHVLCFTVLLIICSVCICLVSSNVEVSTWIIESFYQSCTSEMPLQMGFCLST
jgi:hypothetical protein